MQALHEIERELTRLFPTRLTSLLEFLVASGTSMKDGRGKGRERVGNEILVLGRRLHEAEGVVREGSAAVRSENELSIELKRGGYIYALMHDFFML
ncbi:hypothetical protein PS1_001545 [Malus domestica]